jgi:hypothetical protein
MARPQFADSRRGVVVQLGSWAKKSSMLQNVTHSLGLGGLLCAPSWTFPTHKKQTIPWLAEWLFASQEGISWQQLPASHSLSLVLHCFAGRLRRDEGTHQAGRLFMTPSDSSTSPSSDPPKRMSGGIQVTEQRIKWTNITWHLGQT